VNRDTFSSSSCSLLSLLTLWGGRRDLAEPFPESLLFGVAPLDRASFAGVGLVLLAVTLFASFWPAWRASALDPLEALRE